MAHGSNDNEVTIQKVVPVKKNGFVLELQVPPPNKLQAQPNKAPIAQAPTISVPQELPPQEIPVQPQPRVTSIRDLLQGR